MLKTKSIESQSHMRKVLNG